MEEIYDLAFSFAGEDRDYVQQVKAECEKLSLSVYYDQDRRIEQWGKSFLQEQRKVYGYKTKHFVPFISKHYFAKPIPADEFKAALMTSTKQSQYILPVKMDHTRIPPEYLHEDTQYLHAEDYAPAELARALKQIVDKGAGPAKDVDRLLADELDLPMPKIVPRTYNKYEEAEALLQYLAEQFNKHLPKLKAEGYAPIVRHRDDMVRVRVEKDGHTISALNVFFSNAGDSELGFNYNRETSMSTGSENGHIGPVYDKESRTAAFKLTDYSNFGGENIQSKEEVMRYFWDGMNKDIEQGQSRY